GARSLAVRLRPKKSQIRHPSAKLADWRKSICNHPLVITHPSKIRRIDSIQLGGAIKPGLILASEARATTVGTAGVGFTHGSEGVNDHCKCDETTHGGERGDPPPHCRRVASASHHLAHRPRRSSQQPRLASALPPPFFRPPPVLPLPPPPLSLLLLLRPSSSLSLLLLSLFRATLEPKLSSYQSRSRFYFLICCFDFNFIFFEIFISLHSAVPLKIKRLAREPERFIWAVSMEQSRCINLQTRIGALVQDSNMLFPYADMLNHSFQPNCFSHWRFKDRMLEVMINAGQRIKKGEKMIVNYMSPQKNDMFMQRYGFSSSVNPWDVIQFSGNSQIHLDSFLSVFNVSGLPEEYYHNSQLSSDGETLVDGVVIVAARTLPTWLDRDMPPIPSAERKAVKELKEECL
ncbi:Protein PLASTID TRANSCRIPTIONALLY ACTIVE 14, partial [Camellia lanceoleosa]